MDDGSDADKLAQSYEIELRRVWAQFPVLKGQKFDEGALQQIAQDAAELSVSNLCWNLALGGECLRSVEYAALAERSPEEVVEDIRGGALVGLVGKREAWLPLWQFDDPTCPTVPSPVASRLLGIFQSTLGRAYAPEIVVLWAATRQPELEGREPRAVIRSMPIHALERSAKATAGRLVS